MNTLVSYILWTIAMAGLAYTYRYPEMNYLYLFQGILMGVVFLSVFHPFKRIGLSSRWLNGGLILLSFFVMGQVEDVRKATEEQIALTAKLEEEKRLAEEKRKNKEEIAKLRETDPKTYLERIRTNDALWLAELEHFFPQEHARELWRRKRNKAAREWAHREHYQQYNKIISLQPNARLKTIKNWRDASPSQKSAISKVWAKEIINIIGTAGTPSTSILALSLRECVDEVAKDNTNNTQDTATIATTCGVLLLKKR